MTGFGAAENVSVHFHASGVILNHNFTTEFFMKDKTDCEPCKVLADDVRQGVSSHVSIHRARYDKNTKAKVINTLPIPTDANTATQLNN